MCFLKGLHYYLSYSTPAVTLFLSFSFFYFLFHKIPLVLVVSSWAIVLTNVTLLNLWSTVYTVLKDITSKTLHLLYGTVTTVNAGAPSKATAQEACWTTVSGADLWVWQWWSLVVLASQTPKFSTRQPNFGTRCLWVGQPNLLSDRMKLRFYSTVLAISETIWVKAKWWWTANGKMQVCYWYTNLILNRTTSFYMLQ